MFVWRNILSAICWVCCCTSLYGQNLHAYEDKLNQHFYNNMEPIYGNEDDLPKNTLGYISIKNNTNYKLEKIKRKITPIIGYKWGGNIIHNGDSLLVRSVELGVGLIRGNINEWSSFGPLPMGWDWSYLTLPYLTLEYRWFKRYFEYQGGILENTKLNPFMLNIGVSAGRGGMLSFLPVPLSLNGMVGLSTDFNQIYFRGQVGWDWVGGSIGFMGYYSLSQKKNSLNYPHYLCFNLSFILVRDNKYFL